MILTLAPETGPIPNNPAARILNFATRFRTLPGAIDGNRHTTGEGIAAIVGFDTDDHARLAREVSHLLALPDAARESIRRTPAVPDSFIGELDPIDAWLKRLAGHLSEPLVGPARALNDDTMKALTLVADALALNAAEQTPELEAIAALRADANKLLGDVHQARLNDEISQYIALHLRRIIEALDDYRFTGAAHTNEALATAFGDAYLRSIRPADCAGDERNLMDRFWLLVGRMADLATVGTALVQTHDIVAALTSGKH